MSEMKLTTASYLVLGLVEMAGPVTPYDLKRIASETVVNFWALPHTQIYTQCDRLTDAGFLAERREDEGRRRREFSITKEGKTALDAWREEGSDKMVELRDLSVLKLFFGADPAKLAEQQLEVHSQQLEQYLEVEKQVANMPEGARLALQCGIEHEREFVRFWDSLRK